MAGDQEWWEPTFPFVLWVKPATCPGRLLNSNRTLHTTSLAFHDDNLLCLCAKPVGDNSVQKGHVVDTGMYKTMFV